MQFQLVMAPLTHRVCCSYLFWSNNNRVGKVGNDHDQPLPLDKVHLIRADPWSCLPVFFFRWKKENRKIRDYSWARIGEKMFNVIAVDDRANRFPKRNGRVKGSLIYKRKYRVLRWSYVRQTDGRLNTQECVGNGLRFRPKSGRSSRYAKKNELTWSGKRILIYFCSLTAISSSRNVDGCCEEFSFVI